MDESVKVMSAVVAALVEPRAPQVGSVLPPVGFLKPRPVLTNSARVSPLVVLAPRVSPLGGTVQLQPRPRP